MNCIIFSFCCGAYDEEMGLNTICLPMEDWQVQHIYEFEGLFLVRIRW